MGQLDAKRLKALLAKPGRYADGGGLFFKTTGRSRAYFTYRYRLNGREHEISIGPYPELDLDKARIKHLRLSADVAEGVDPAADRKAAKRGVVKASKTGTPTFGDMVAICLEKKDGELSSAKSRWQWTMTLRKYAEPLHLKPVDQVDTDMILAVLRPLWTKTPETASRLRGRIEKVLNMARALKHIDAGVANAAQWKGNLEELLPKRKKLDRGHHAAMPYREVPALMARLGETPRVAARALTFTILTCARSGETFGMQWSEVSFETATWTIPKERMKMGVEHLVPLSEQALAILQEAERSRNPHVFPGARPMQKLGATAMSTMMRRLGAGEFTVHGFRSSFRDWAAETGVAFETAEQCLAHTVGSAVTRSYLRTTMLERRRKVMSEWSAYICPVSNVVQLRAAQS
jgi:integrase